jgi:hypothetical protein
MSTLRSIAESHVPMVQPPQQRGDRPRRVDPCLSGQRARRLPGGRRTQHVEAGALIRVANCAKEHGLARAGHAHDEVDAPPRRGDVIRRGALGHRQRAADAGFRRGHGQEDVAVGVAGLEPAASSV